MVYFHAVDVVLGRNNLVRRAWQSRCHLPKVYFFPKKGRTKAGRASTKLQNYGLFKRMIAVKSVVFDRHKRMFRLYEKYCEEASLTTYWPDAGSDDDEEVGLAPADDTKEVDCDEGF